MDNKSKPEEAPTKPAPMTSKDYWSKYATDISALNSKPTKVILEPLKNRSEPNRPGGSKPSTSSYSSYIKPATAGAFSPASALPKPSTSIKQAPPSQPVEEEGEVFDINAVELTAADYARFEGDAEEHMRELLSGAVGDGEEDAAAMEGEDVVEGFASNVRLMPHQVRGIRWMRQRESGRKYGGILADDMGLGKTVQTLARIVEGVHTSAEKKAFRGGTLIVAPLAVMEQWALEVKTKTPGLKVQTHHGPSRTKVPKKLEAADIVITTFQTLASEHRASTPVVDSDSDSDAPKVKRKGAAPSALYQVKWLRVVIDEAQNIKNRKTNAAKAAVALQAKYRWCLTGTPIQNNVDELYTLFQFLRAKPLDKWETFRERVSGPVSKGQTAIAMKRLHVLLKAVMLRRTKDATIDGKPILNLPARLVEVVECEFDSEERAFYDALEQRTQLTFNKFLKAGTAMANYTSVLTMLLRLRQACDHPSLVTAATASVVEDKQEDSADELADMLEDLGVANEVKCRVCFTKLDGDALVCKECEEISEKVQTPSSAKIRKLLELLKNIQARKEKTIVFSQFTSFLNLVEPFLKEAEISYVRYDGSMRNDKRQEALDAIRTKADVRVILISFKAGSTGLNLTCCNNVVLMDLWWNPALEDQAFDRAHRLGQTLDVNIYKLTIARTVEDRILELQDSKRELAKAALSDGKIKSMKLSMADIMRLFRL